MRKYKLHAFTLAEVLITLTILGVVAAVTVPSIIQHYKRAIVITKLKVAYSTLQSAISVSEAENGGAERWDWTLSKDIFLEKYILPYISYQSEPNKSGVWLNKIQSIKSLKNDSWTANDRNWGITNMRWIKLKNGMDIGINKGIHGVWDGDCFFWVDINGLNKGNNTVGKEIFMFTLAINSTSMNLSNVKRNVRAFFEPSYYAELTPTPNKYTAAQVSGTATGNCNKNAGTNKGLPAGAWCSYLIYQNGWKIPDNYPVKF